MDVDKEVCVKTDCKEYNGEAPVVAQGVAEDGWFCLKPTPIPADWSEGIHIEPSTAYLDISIAQINVCPGIFFLLVASGIIQIQQVIMRLVVLSVLGL